MNSNTIATIRELCNYALDAESVSNSVNKSNEVNNKRHESIILENHRTIEMLQKQLQDTRFERDDARNKLFEVTQLFEAINEYTRDCNKRNAFSTVTAIHDAILHWQLKWQLKIIEGHQAV